MERMTAAVAALITACVLAGCGLSDPYQHHAATSTTRSSTHSTTTPADLPDPPSERGGQIPESARAAEDHPAAGAGAPSARAAVERYTRLYVNWSAGKLVADQRHLAHISIGAARQQAQQAAASASTDTQLTADHVSNTGQVVSATPGAGPAAGQWVIVTSEKTAGNGDYAGLPPAVHVTYAKVTHTDQGWVISQWTPQS
jgi:hypothetical protein